MFSDTVYFGLSLCLSEGWIDAYLDYEQRAEVKPLFDDLREIMYLRIQNQALQKKAEKKAQWLEALRKKLPVELQKAVFKSLIEMSYTKPITVTRIHALSCPLGFVPTDDPIRNFLAQELLRPDARTVIAKSAALAALLPPFQEAFFQTAAFDLDTKSPTKGQPNRLPFPAEFKGSGHKIRHLHITLTNKGGNRYPIDLFSTTDGIKRLKKNLPLLQSVHLYIDQVAFLNGKSGYNSNVLLKRGFNGAVTEEDLMTEEGRLVEQFLLLDGSIRKYLRVDERISVDGVDWDAKVKNWPCGSAQILSVKGLKGVEVVEKALLVGDCEMELV